MSIVGPSDMPPGPCRGAEGRLILWAGTPSTSGKHHNIHYQSHCGGHPDQTRPQTWCAFCYLTCMHIVSHMTNALHKQYLQSFPCSKYLIGSMCVTLLTLQEQAEASYKCCDPFNECCAVVPTTTPVPLVISTAPLVTTSQPLGTTAPVVTTSRPLSTMPLRTSTIPATTQLVPSTTPGGAVPLRRSIVDHMAFTTVTVPCVFLFLLMLEHACNVSRSQPTSSPPLPRRGL